MRSSGVEQLCGKAISHQLPAKLQLSSHILLSLSPPLFPTLITSSSPSLWILSLGDRVFGPRLGQGNNFIFLFVKLYINRGGVFCTAVMEGEEDYTLTCELIHHLCVQLHGQENCEAFLELVENTSILIQILFQNVLELHFTLHHPLFFLLRKWVYWGVGWGVVGGTDRFCNC